MRHLFRFAAALPGDPGVDPMVEAQRLERLGFDLAVVGDHVGPWLSPLLRLTAAATGTTVIKLGTEVLNADLRNPVQLAWEALTLDRLSRGRFELGLGAGHTPQEYTAIGAAMRPARERKRRLMEFIEVTRRLLDGEVVTHRGEHFVFDNAHVGEPVGRVPILVGGNGRALLEHAGEHADVVGLQGLGRTLADGHRHSVNWTVEHLERQLDVVRRGAAKRGREPEFSALVQFNKITNDRESEISAFCDRVGGLSVEDAATAPYLLVGTVSEIVTQLRDARDRWGISSFSVRDADEFAPVLDALDSPARDH